MEEEFALDPTDVDVIHLGLAIIVKSQLVLGCHPILHQPARPMVNVNPSICVIVPVDGLEINVKHLCALENCQMTLEMTQLVYALVEVYAKLLMYV
jgi:hypothetical protein